MLDVAISVNRMLILLPLYIHKCHSLSWMLARYHLAFKCNLLKSSVGTTARITNGIVGDNVLDCATDTVSVVLLFACRDVHGGMWSLCFGADTGYACV